ncbi:unnamed protein product [Arabidopsis halleri]
MRSSTFSSIIFLLLLVFSLHMDEALGAQTEIRKLKETIKMRRNLKGNDYKNSKMEVLPSLSPHCPGSKRLKNMVTTNDYQGPDSFTCMKCILGQQVCLTCTYTKHCESFNGSPPSCSYKEQICCAVPPALYNFKSPRDLGVQN